MSDKRQTKLILRSRLLKHQLNQLPSSNKHVSSTPPVRGHFCEALSVIPHVGPITHVGSTPPVTLNASTPSLEAYGNAPLDALDCSPPGISPHSIQGSNPRIHETFTFEDDQNVSDVQSTSEKPILTIDGYGYIA